ncbi:MAG: hypothetical protein IKY10_02055 [Clostridia bacterium]|nr:hypothetical protein [Clostridia bacterium]
MKRKFLSLILVFLLLPTAFLFSACKDKGYNLNNLQKDFNQVATNNENIKLIDGEIYFDYTNHVKLNTIIEYNFPYTQLKEYNEIHKNIMAFTFDYIDECSNNSAVKDVAIKNQLRNELDDLKKAYAEVNLLVNNLAEVTNLTNDVMDETATSTLLDLLIAYEDLFNCAGYFNNTLADVYFNHVLTNGNPNIFKIGSENFDVNVVINKFDARLKYQKSNLSHCFAEMYINSGEFAEQIANGLDFVDLDRYDYADNIDAIDKTFTEIVAAEKASSGNKQKYFNLSVQAYNIQEALKNDNSKFIHACKRISYATIKLLEATAEEKMCVEIIEQRYELVTIYNDVLVSMLSLTI